MSIFNPLYSNGSNIVSMLAGNGGIVSIPANTNNNFMREENASGFILHAWFFIPNPANKNVGDSCNSNAVNSNLPSPITGQIGITLKNLADNTIIAINSGANQTILSTPAGYINYLVNADLYPAIYYPASAVNISISWGAFTCTGSFINIKNQITFSYQGIMVTK